MNKTSYFLIIGYQGKGHVMKIDNCDLFIDITFLDLFTEQYTREELLSFYGFPTDNQTDIFIMRTKTGQNNQYTVDFYDCLFKGSKIDLFELQQHRLKKILKKEDNIRIDDNIKYQQIVYRLLNSITSDQKRILQPILADKTFDNPYIKKLLNEIYIANKTTKLNSLMPKFLEKFSSYKVLRGLYMSYIKQLYLRNEKPLPEALDRENLNYESFCFGYTDYFYISIENANGDPDRHFFSLYGDQIDNDYSQALQEQKVMEDLNRNPFKNSKIEYYYNLGGIEAVWRFVDADEIYTSPLGDLVKLGIIPIQEYLVKKLKKGGFNKL